jgi:hypothetical protein
MEMKIIVTRAADNGRFHDLGTTNRWLFSDITAEAGAIERARQYSRGLAYRIEFFQAERFYNCEPFRVIFQSAFDFQAEPKAKEH